MIQDISEDIFLTWRVDGKVKTVKQSDNKPEEFSLSFDYDAMGHRIAKHSYDKDPTYNNGLGQLVKSTYYVLDASGNVMSVYEREVDSSAASVTFEQAERHIYGSSRLGVMNASVPLLGTQNDIYSQTSWIHTIGQRTYELSNHLGNVLSVISDKVIPHNNGGNVDYYLADIRQSTDYSPFGVTLYGRNFSVSGADGFRYGFNGMESDDEISGEGNSYDFGARFHDPRLGRFLSVDPVAHLQEELSSYSFAGNSPIYYIDFGGGFKWPGTAEEQKALENKYPNVTKMMQNIHKLADEYPELINKMSEMTGLTPEQVKENLTYGKGAEIVIIPTGSDEEASMLIYAARTPDERRILIREATINDAENAKGDELNQGLFALAILFLHEEVHRGDRITNGGDITGQWDDRQCEENCTGPNKDKKWKYKGGDDAVAGKQKRKWSSTGHRGSDLEVEVFNAPKGKVPNKAGGGFSSNEDYSVDRNETMTRNPSMTKEKLQTIFK